MFNYLRLSYNLLRLANSVLDRRKEKFKKELEGLDLSGRELEESLDCLIGIKDHLVRKMCVHWLKKGTIILPEDLPKVEKAKDLAKKNRGIDYIAFDSPVEIIDKFEEKAKIEFDRLLKPDSLPELYNKVDLGEGVTVYTVVDSKEGQYAVRRLADSHFGVKFDEWCITGRYPKLYPKEKRDDMGMVLDSFNNWKNTYNAYPKRLAFKDGKFFAFCANSRKEILWWDQNDKPFEYIPKHKHLGDDDDFINEYIVKDLVDELKTDRVGKFEAAKNRHLPIDILVKLSSDVSWRVRSCVAQNPNVPADILIKLSEDEDEEVRSCVAENPNTSVEVLVKLSKDENNRVRKAIAKNPNTPPEVLVKLSSDEALVVRGYIAKNPNTPVEVLVKLSSDGVLVVRDYIAKNPNTPVEVLIKLSSDIDADVRGYVAKNPNTPAEILIKLSEDEDGYVRAVVAQNPNTPVDILIKLSKDEYWKTRRFVARNPSTPVDILAKLSNDEESWIRESVAGNPNTPVDILVKLSEDKKSYVQDSALRNLRKRGIDV